MSKDIIGISIGSKNTIVGTYKKGTFEIVVSETSARSLPTVVSYNDRERNFAELSMHTNRSNFKRIVIYPNRWLGVQKDWPLVKEEAKYAYVKPVEDKTGRLGFNIDYKGKKDIYTPESLMGLFFSKLKSIWLKENINTTSVVVSVPDYYTAHERKAMVEALEIGGLQCTALLNESSAITLTYGFHKLKEFDEEKYRTVAFVDLGHSTCNIFFSQFNKKNVKVISVSSERFCGAREFDYLIAQKLAEDFEKKYGCNPMEAPKTKIRLIDTITKVRKSLTVNKEITISVDSLMEGEDLVYNLSRDEFEKIIEPVVKKFEQLCKNAIEKFEKETKLKIGNIHSIEMVGDTVRTPIILESIKKVMGKEVSKTLVPDECIARGCSLYAMMNSPYFAIQNFSFSHYNPYTIEMEYPYVKDGKETIKKFNLINEGADFPASKTITFTKNQLPEKDIVPLKFYYKDSPTINWLPNKLLNSFNIHLKKKKENEWKLIIKYGLDINCIPKLEGTTMNESKIEMVPVVETAKVKEEKKAEEKKPDDKKPEDKKPGDKKPDDKKPEEKKPEEKKPEQKKPEEKKPEEKKPEDKSPKDKKPEDKKPEEKKPEEKKPEEKPKMKEKKVEIESKLDVDIVETLFGTAKGILDQYIKREKTQTKEDEVYREASRLKNSLEQYIYTTKEKFDSQLKGYYTDKERTDLTQFMDTLMTWLYSEDEKLYDKQTLLDNSKNMKQLGDAIYKRCQDWTNLRNNYTIFESVVGELTTAISAEEEKLKKKEFTYLTNEDIVKVNTLITDAIENSHKKHELTDKAPQIQLPPIQPDEIDMLTKNLKTNVKKVYDDAEFKVKEEERKRKEAEEKKKKEEEEKKKKEEEEKKKKEEEEKKKKEEEEKKKKGEEDKDKKGDKKPDKKDPTNPDNDVNMKDATQPQPAPQNPPKEADNMDVE